LSGRNPKPTINLINKNLKGIANGPTQINFGVATLKSDFNSNTGKVRYYVEVIMDEVVANLDEMDPDDWLDSLDEFNNIVHQPGGTVGGAGAQL
jgi:hypothetical protein